MSDYSIEEIYEVAREGSHLCKVLDTLRHHYFPEDDPSFIQWWYDHNGRLGQSPDQLCKEGKEEELEKILMDILTAAQGG